MPDPTVPPVTTPPAAEPPAAAPPAADNLLSATNQPPAGDPAKPAATPPPASEIPEKFRKPDGTLNGDAVLRSYTELEKRLGNGDAPPKTPDEYKINYNLPEGVELNKEQEKSFLASCHAAGMSNKQVQFVMDKYAGILGNQVKDQVATKEKAEAALKEAWKETYDENMVNARKAFDRLADEADRAVVHQIGNNPAVLKMLAKIGANLKEDTPPAGNSSVVSDEDIQALMRSEAYWNNKHPEHASVKAKVTAYHQKKFSKTA